jgi:hypothetical protein
MTSLKNIYGVSPSSADGCNCVISPSIHQTLLKFADLVNAIKQSVEKYLPAVDASLSLEGRMTVGMSVPPIIMVRLLWREKYPGPIANYVPYFYRTTIREFYYQLNLATLWEQDPLSKIVD